MRSLSVRVAPCGWACSRCCWRGRRSPAPGRRPTTAAGGRPTAAAAGAFRQAPLNPAFVRYQKLISPRAACRAVMGTTDWASRRRPSTFGAARRRSLQGEPAQLPGDVRPAHAGQGIVGQGPGTQRHLLGLRHHRLARIVSPAGCSRSISLKTTWCSPAASTTRMATTRPAAATWKSTAYLVALGRARPTRARTPTATTTVPPASHRRKHVQDVDFLPGRSDSLDNDTIKAAVMAHGGVYSDIHVGDHRPVHLLQPHQRLLVLRRQPGSNHAVLIVGWDDNYPAVQLRVPRRRATAPSSSRTAGAPAGATAATSTSPTTTTQFGYDDATGRASTTPSRPATTRASISTTRWASAPTSAIGADTPAGSPTCSRRSPTTR